MRKDDYYKSLVKKFDAFQYKHDMITVFEDFLYMAAASFSNVFDKIHYEKREAEYIRIINKYEKNERELFPIMLVDLVMLFERAVETGQYDDYLGRLFMQLDLGNSARGQFFTPYHISLVMANMIIQPEDIAKHVEEKGYFTMLEPTCGAGGMVIAAYNAVLDAGFNPQKVMRVVSQDIDRRAVLMTYIQSTLLSIDNTVILGNSLMMEQKEVWYTPAHFMNLANMFKNKGLKADEVKKKTEQHIQEDLSHLVDDVYYDEERGTLMQMITLSGGDADNKPCKYWPR